MEIKAFISENSPTILTIGGITALAVGTVLACRATLKAQKVVEEHKESRNSLENDEKAPEKGSKEYTQQLAHIYAKTLKGMTKLYAVPVILIVSGVVSILGGHKILSERNVQLTNSLAAVTTAYNQLDKFTKNYRKRVVEAEGELKDKQYAFGFPDDKVDTVDADGKKVKLGKDDLHTKDGVSDKDISDLEKVNPYVTVFDKRSIEWKNSPVANLAFIKGQLNAWNDIARSRIATAKSDGLRPIITQNEIRKSMDLPETPEGAITGWDLSSDDYDGYISFGLDTAEVKYPQNELFLQGYLTACVLEFNCTGLVYDKFGQPVDYAWMNK